MPREALACCKGSRSGLVDAKWSVGGAIKQASMLNDQIDSINRSPSLGSVLCVIVGGRMQARHWVTGQENRREKQNTTKHVGRAC